MYEKLETIYLYTMPAHLILNIVTQEKGRPQGIMIRGLAPTLGIEVRVRNRSGIEGVHLSNGPGKLVAALGISKVLYGQSIYSSPLRLIPEKRKYPQKIRALPRIVISNKGIGPINRCAVL